MVDQNGENALARAYPVSDARDHRPGSATNGQGLPPGGRRRLKKLVQERGRRLRKLKLASLNVGSMTGRSGETVQLMRKKSLQVLCVQETKWKGSKAREIGAGYKLYHHGEDGTKNGVGIVLSEDMRDRVLAVERTCDRVRRNFTKGTNANIREQIYTSLVRPTLEYGSVAWDPHQANRIQMLESVQNKGARYVTQEWSRYSSITDIKDKLGWCTLQQRRYVNRLSFFFKSVNNLHGHSLPPHVTRQKRASKNHHAYSYHTLRARTDAYLHSFLPRAIRAWNNLPQEIVLAPSPESFRAQLANKLRSNQITLATSSMTTVPRPGIPIHTF